MSVDPTTRYIVRYRRRADQPWKRAPRFITRRTGYRTHAAALAKLAMLRRDGYAGHVARVDWLRPLALQNARKLIGVMEHGGNNQGERVMQIIRENGGTGPEPWCGDFVAKVYRDAGSKAVTRSWAAVRLLGSLSGMRRIPKRAGTPGDLIRFTFDHVGILEAFTDANGDVMPAEHATHVRTIEGNTGASGAVSDSSTGGDGVYRKLRSLSLVSDCVQVLR